MSEYKINKSSLCTQKLGKKGIALFMILATILVIVILANVVLSIISIQGRLSHHEVSRIRAYYAAQAGLVYTMEMIRNGNSSWAPNASGGANKYACHRSCIDPGITADVTIPTDDGIPFNIQVTIRPYGTAPDDVGTALESKADYTYVAP